MPDIDTEVRQRTGDRQVALRAFFKIADAWRLTVEEQISLLGKPPRSTFFKWKKDGGDLPHDTLERISHIQGIYKCLRILFTDDAVSNAWMKRPNAAPFANGVSAIEFMAQRGFVSDIYEVRKYLDAQRGG